MTIEKPLCDLVEQLNKKLRPEDFKDLLDASKDDCIDEKELGELSSFDQWVSLLVEKLLLTNDDLSFIEHVFELCRRPDLLTTVLEYRLKNLEMDISAPQQRREITRMPSAKKYMVDKMKSVDEKPLSNIKLSDPPKTRRKSTAC